jgi:(p)ppGpp synthase/HD superfamily hydrolase
LRRSPPGHVISIPLLVSELRDGLGDLEASPALRGAYELAVEAHRGQTRKDGASPYIGHPIAVARELRRNGLPEETVVAGVLHDVVEDSELTVGDVVEQFGVRVGELVAALTDDRHIDDYEERKREHRGRVEEAGPDAAAIYAADKLVNVREMRRLYAELGEEAAERLKAPIGIRVALWHGDLEMLRRVIPELPTVAALAAELEVFEAQRSRARQLVDVA